MNSPNKNDAIIEPNFIAINFDKEDAPKNVAHKNVAIQTDKIPELLPLGMLNPKMPQSSVQQKEEERKKIIERILAEKFKGKKISDMNIEELQKYMQDVMSKINDNTIGIVNSLKDKNSTLSQKSTYVANKLINLGVNPIPNALGIISPKEAIKGNNKMVEINNYIAPAMWGLLASQLKSPPVNLIIPLIHYLFIQCNDFVINNEIKENFIRTAAIYSALIKKVKKEISEEEEKEISEKEKKEISEEEKNLVMTVAKYLENIETSKNNNSGIYNIFNTLCSGILSKISDCRGNHFKLAPQKSSQENDKDNPVGCLGSCRKKIADIENKGYLFDFAFSISILFLLGYNTGLLSYVVPSAFEPYGSGAMLGFIVPQLSNILSSLRDKDSIASLQEYYTIHNIPNNLYILSNLVNIKTVIYNSYKEEGGEEKVKKSIEKVNGIIKTLFDSPTKSFIDQIKSFLMTLEEEKNPNNRNIVLGLNYIILEIVDNEKILDSMFSTMNLRDNKCGLGFNEILKTIKDKDDRKKDRINLEDKISHRSSIFNTMVDHGSAHNLIQPQTSLEKITKNDIPLKKR